MDAVILFGGLIILMALGFSITISMGLAALIFLLVTGQNHMLIMLPNKMVLGLEHYGLMAIPLFYLAGGIMSAGGLTQRLVRFSQVLIGHVPGSLSLINVMASMFFAGVSGSCTADASAIGSVLIPGMKKEGYSSEYAAAVTGAAATIGHIIPPSIPMVLIGVMQELPIGGLFLAGAVPGLILGFALMGLCFVISLKRSYPRSERRSTLREMGRGTLDGLLVLMMPAIIVGGIVLGVVTVTETAVLATIYALLLAFIYREMTLPAAWAMLKHTVKGSANVLMIMTTASFFSWVVLNTGLGDQVVEIITAVSTNKFVVLSLLVVFLLLIGCALDVLAMIFIFIPVFLPLVEKVGIHPFHFSAVFVLTLGIALLTPPVGIILFLVSDMAGTPVGRVIKESGPFLAVQMAVLALVTFVPALSTWLPSLLAM